MSTLPIYNETDLGTLRSGLYLGLFHGRDDAEVLLENWGYNGPMLGPLRYVHTTYANEIKFAFEEHSDWVAAFPGESTICGYRLNPAWRDLPGYRAPSVDALRANPALAEHPAVDTVLRQTEGWLSVKDGLVIYNGRFYGDWTVFHHPGVSPDTTIKE